MCGICGIVSLSEGDIPVRLANFSNARIWPMLERMNHRGPQGPGVKIPAPPPSARSAWPFAVSTTARSR
jgi:asparagine synthetase B (glutamine-hydrolysing)